LRGKGLVTYHADSGGPETFIAHRVGGGVLEGENEGGRISRSACLSAAICLCDDRWNLV